VTQDVFGTQRSVDRYMKKIEEEGRGVIIYLREGSVGVGQKDHGRKLRQGEEAHAEAKAREEAARVQAEAAAAAKAGDAAKAAELNTQAEQIKAKANEDAATALTTAAVLSMPAPVAHVSKPAGFSTRAKWKARVTNKLELVKFIAANPQFLHVLDENQGALDKLAGALMENFNLVGAEAYKDTIAAVR
jgi:hypothetical protein